MLFIELNAIEVAKDRRRDVQQMHNFREEDRCFLGHHLPTQPPTPSPQTMPISNLDVITGYRLNYRRLPFPV